MTDVMVPSLGESVSEATVSTWFKKAGRYGQAGRNAVRTGNRQGLGRGAHRRSPACWPKSSPPKAPPLPPTRGLRDRDRRRRRPPPRAKAAAKAAAAAAASRPPPAPRTSKTPPPRKRRWPRPGWPATQVAGTGRDGRVMKEDVARAAAAAPVAAAPRPRRHPARPGSRR